MKVIISQNMANSLLNHFAFESQLNSYKKFTKKYKGVISSCSERRIIFVLVFFSGVLRPVLPLLLILFDGEALNKVKADKTMKN